MCVCVYTYIYIYIYIYIYVYLDQDDVADALDVAKEARHITILCEYKYMIG